jgi:HSP20 family protein
MLDDLFTKDFIPELFENGSFKSVPAVNIVEGNNEFTIEVAAPGLNKKDFNISLDNNQLTISSEKEDKTGDQSEKIVRKEFRYDSFCRTFTLPETVESDKISARHNDGILYVTIPKKEVAKIKSARQIQVS